MQTATESLVTLYLEREGPSVFMLKSAKTEAGFWLAQPPVIELQSIDTASLSNRLRDALLSPTAVVPTPKRDSFPTPTSLGIPFKQGWRAFENRFQTVTMALSKDGTYEVGAYLQDGSLDQAKTLTYSGPDAFTAVLDNISNRISSLALSH